MRTLILAKWNYFYLLELVCLYVCSEIYILSRKVFKWHIYFSSVYIMMNDNISRIGDQRHVKHTVVPLDLAAHTLQPVFNLPLPFPSLPPLPLLPSPTPSLPPLPLPAFYAPWTAWAETAPIFCANIESSSDIENQIKKCPFTCLHITICLFTAMLLGYNSNTTY